MDDSVHPTIVMDERVHLAVIQYKRVPYALPPISWMTVCIPLLSWMTGCASHHCHGWKCVHSHQYHGWQCVSHHYHGWQGVHPTIVMDDSVCIPPLSWMTECAFPPLSWMTVCIPPLSWITGCASHHCHGWQWTSHHYHGWQRVHSTIVMDNREHPSTIMDDSVCIPSLSWMTGCASHHYQRWQFVHSHYCHGWKSEHPTNIKDKRMCISPPSHPPPWRESSSFGTKGEYYLIQPLNPGVEWGRGKMHSLGKIGKNFTQFLLFWGLKYVLAVFHLFSVITSPHSFTLYILKNGNSFLTAYYQRMEPESLPRDGCGSSC